MRELIKPEHLQFVGKMFGIKEEINDETNPNNLTTSYGANNSFSQSSLPNVGSMMPPRKTA